MFTPAASNSCVWGVQMKKLLLTTLVVPALLVACKGNRDAVTSPDPPRGAPDYVARAASAITSDFLREAVTRLASDEMMGRGPGTVGDRFARDYLIRRLEMVGCEPAFNAGQDWEQLFSIVGLTTALPEQWSFRRSGGEALTVERWHDYMGATGVQQATAGFADAEVVFVGYGITAPEEAWDDFKGVDVTGKVLLMLNDDPEWDPELFAGERKLYYGRWTYKYESAAAHGAAGAIIIHTTPSAGYPWQVVQTSWSGEQFEVPAGAEPRLQFQAWMTDEAARNLVEFAGRDLDQLIDSARDRDFRPVTLDLKTSIDLAVEIRKTDTANVGGVLLGSDPVLKNEVVIVSAHHDHLGEGEPDASGDRIYNGALDNGVAMAQALAVAEAVARLPERPRRSLLFLFVAAEEQGLLGSKYFARHPSVPPGRIAADINFELGNVWGRTQDVTIFGKGKSTLEDLLAELAEEQGRYVTEEKTLRAGWYYRSDQFSFARIGVPAIWFKSGTDYVDRADGWGDDVQAAWIDQNYHRPSDEVEESWVFDGLVEDSLLAFRLVLEVADADEMPSWYPGDEFEDERLAALAG
jgi:Zn-dependent M28 family amino/carboxypeptidase